MPSEHAHTGADHLVAALAARQYGVVSFAQLLSLGLTARSISRRVVAGRLSRLHRGVYAVGHTALRREGWWLAAVLACGDGAVLSHRTAAVVWGMLAPSGSRVHVAVPSRAGRARRTGIAVHRPVALDAEDVTTHDGLPLTTPTRTLVDLAATVRRRELRRALAEAERLRLPVDPQAIDRLVTRPGARRLQAALADLRVADGWTRSELEREFLRLAERAGLPQPAVNTVVAGHEVDFAWHRPAPLVVETDGHAFHHTRQAFEDDHVRTVALRLAGYDVLRVTHRQVVRDPDTVIKALRQALEPTPPRPWTQGRGEARTTTW